MHVRHYSLGVAYQEAVGGVAMKSLVSREELCTALCL
jgi:hypothetical protein